MMYLKAVMLFLYLLISVSCTTFRYYHATHEFKERAYNPVKKGRVELTVYGETTYSERPGAITSWQRAHKKGLKSVKRSIKQFCEGKYIINTITEKKENLGTRTDTSYHSDYSSHRDSYGHGAHSDYGMSDSRNTVSGGDLINKAMGGVYSKSDSASKYGHSDGYSTTRTAPVFREYTDIIFRCK